MWLRMRQIALVAPELAPVTDDLRAVFGVEVAYRDPGVGFYGLENALFPFGNQLLEVVAPTREDTAGGRYLERRGGAGGYMVITQCDDHEPRRARVKELGIRLVTDRDGHEYRIMQLHPKDTGGSFLEIDEQLGPGAHDEDGPWEPAGPEWQKAKRTDRVSGIAAAEVQCDDPAKTAARWSEIVQIPLAKDAAGRPTIACKDATIRFVPCSDGRPEGLGGIDIKVADRPAILAAAKARNLPVEGDCVMVCGMRMRLV